MNTVLPLPIVSFSSFSGKAPGSTLLLPFTQTSAPDNASTTVTNLEHGETVYVTVRCQNYVGLQSVAMSKGVTFITNAPNTTYASISFIPNLPSYYGANDNHQVGTGHTVLTYEGLDDPTGIKSYEVGFLFFIILIRIDRIS